MGKYLNKKFSNAYFIALKIKNDKNQMQQSNVL